MTSTLCLSPPHPDVAIEPWLLSVQWSGTQERYRRESGTTADPGPPVGPRLTHDRQ